MYTKPREPIGGAYRAIRIPLLDRVLSIFTGRRAPQNPFPKGSPFFLAWSVSRCYHTERTPEQWLAALLGENLKVGDVR